MITKGRTIGFTHHAITTSTNKRFDNCNDLTFINKGTVQVQISDNFILQPGQSFTYTAWPGEVNNTAYDITFPSPAANGQLLIAVCKNYMD